MKQKDSETFTRRPRPFFYLLVFAGLVLLATGGLLLLFLSSLLIPAIIVIALSVVLMVGLGVHYAVYKPPHIVMPAPAFAEVNSGDIQISNSTPVVEVVDKKLEQPPGQVPLEDKTHASGLTPDEKPTSFNSPLSNKSKKQKIACPPMIRPQIEAALRGYSGSGPLKIYLFTDKEIKLIQTLMLGYGERNRMALQNTPETIEAVENYVRGGFLENSKKVYQGEYNERYLLFIKWLNEIIPDCGITRFSSPYEDTPVQLDEKDALELSKKYTLPDTEIDLIAQALENPVYTENYLLIPFLSEPELSLIYKGLDHKCCISKRHPAVLQITSPAYETMRDKIRGVMGDANLHYMFNGTIGLDKTQVEEFKERYFASTQAASNRFVST